MTLGVAFYELMKQDPHTLVYLYEGNEDEADCIEVGDLVDLKAWHQKDRRVLSIKREFFPDQGRGGVEIIVEGA